MTAVEEITATNDSTVCETPGALLKGGAGFRKGEPLATAKVRRHSKEHS